MVSMLPALLASVSLAAALPSYCQTNVVNRTIVNGSVPINIDPLWPMNMAALEKLNSTVFESWSFNVVSHSTKSGVTMTFFRDPSMLSHNLGIFVEAVLEDGTQLKEAAYFEKSSVTVCRNETIGVWDGEMGTARFQFTGENRDVKITLEMDMVDGKCIEGEAAIKSISTARYPDGQAWPSPYSSVEMAPMIYWTSGRPAGNATTKLNVGNHALHFDGIGGMDHNWGPYSYSSTTEKWYWIHGVAGPFTFVYRKVTSAIDHKTYVSAYLEKDGTQIFWSDQVCSISIRSNCAILNLKYNGKIKGNFNDISTGNRLQFRTKEKSWSFEIDHENLEWESSAFQFPDHPIRINYEYSRFVNSAFGGEVNGEEFRGVSRGEQNKMRVVDPIS